MYLHLAELACEKALRGSLAAGREKNYPPNPPWNLLITRLDLDNVTFENFKSVLYGYYSRALAINYDPDSPRSFKSICLKCNTARFVDQEISCCM